LNLFGVENSALLQQISLQLQDTILVCKQSFIQVQIKLKQLDEQLPLVNSEAELVKNSVDKKHKASTKATIAGSSSSLLGGALMIGEILGAPFTFRTSLGVTVAGAILTGAGAVTNEGYKVYDHRQAKKVIL